VAGGNIGYGECQCAIGLQFRVRFNRRDYTTIDAESVRRHEYNEESFFVRHAYFLGQNDPYGALKTTLKAQTVQPACVEHL